MKNNIKFIRNDTKKITLEKFIEGGENYYIIFGKPAKLEQAMSFSSFSDIEYDSITNGVIPKNINLKEVANATYANIASHIIETNLLEGNPSFEERQELVMELDRACPELVEYIETVIENDIEKIPENKKPLKIKK